MRSDNHAPPLSTSSPEAARALVDGIRGFNHWHLDTMERVDAALAIDPAFPMAHAVRGLLLGTGRNERFRPQMMESLHAARQGVADVSTLEQLYVDALSSFAGGRLHEAVLCYETILIECPTDLFAHRLPSLTNSGLNRPWVEAASVESSAA